jgi:hypothetical protein
MDSRFAEIDIVVGRDGKAQVSIQGAPGAACKSLTAPYEEALGRVTSDVPTAEMHAAVARSADRAQVKRG